MSGKKNDMDFSAEGVSAAYDNILVPVLFEPWARSLVKAYPPPPRSTVVDLATGTGVVAAQLLGALPGSGEVICVDISEDMLGLAKKRCTERQGNVRFLQSPAAPLGLDAESADLIYCQQGFQFFPNRSEVAAELFRVLRPGGKVIVTTWCDVGQCAFFGAITKVLNQCGYDEMAQIMGVPFNHMPADELKAHFSSSSFQNVSLKEQIEDLVFEGGVEDAYRTVYGTPVGPRLKALPEDERAVFRNAMIAALTEMTVDGVTTGVMTTNLLVALKSG